MNQTEFIEKLRQLGKDKKILKWWWGQKVDSHALNTSVQILLLIYTPVTRQLFQFFNCHEVTPEMIYLRQDYSIECFKSEWNLALVYVIFVTILFAFGFPAAMVYYLHRHRKELYTPKIQSRIGFLYSSYQQGVEFWEVHELFRKTLLTGVLVYISTPILQVVFALFICLMSIANVNFFQPHKDRLLFWLGELSFLITSLKYLVAAFLLNYPTTIENSENFDRASIGIFLICLDVVFFLGSTVIGAYAVYSLKATLQKIESEHKKINHKSTSILPVASEENKKNTIENEISSNLEMLQDIRRQFGADSSEYKLKLLEIKK